MVAVVFVNSQHHSCYDQMCQINGRQRQGRRRSVRNLLPGRRFLMTY